MDSDFPTLNSKPSRVGGTLKLSPEDFIVEEIPAYSPCGVGEHLFLWIEKRNVSTDELLQHLARSLNISQRAIGIAGMKDRLAVTRQFVSVPVSSGEQLSHLETENIRILSNRRHTNKLRTGHLRGNRFVIVLRNVDADAAPRIEQTSQLISKYGFPNYFGTQRFGSNHKTLKHGVELLSQDASIAPTKKPHSPRRFRLALSAVQSWLFNQLLARRIQEDIATKVLRGDVMQVIASGGLFVAERTDREQQRHDSGETAITGPIFGPKMKRPQHGAAEIEAEVLEASGLILSAFSRFPKMTRGTRRPLMVRPDDFDVMPAEDGTVRIQFTLPPGAYATVLMDEFVQRPKDNKSSIERDRNLD